MNKSKISRIITIDLLRAFAVIMMIQGHTIHSILEVTNFSSESLFYSIWIFFRAFTAPIFIFSSGLVFAFLLFQRPVDFNNPRVTKGLVRGFSLILIGYILRYPTIKILNISKASYSQWLTFFTVDALHLIGLGLILIVAFAFLSEKFRINPKYLFGLFSLVILFISPFVHAISWETSPMVILISYISFQFGSIFPIFPYLQYIFLGAIFGILLANNNSFLKNPKNIIAILLFAAVFIVASFFVGTSYTASFLRIGVVFSLLVLFEVVLRNKKKLPMVIQSLGKNSLWIYIIHLIIVYGSPTSIGLHQIVGKTLSTEITILVTLSMLIFMTIISLGIDKFRVTKYNLFSKRN